MFAATSARLAALSLVLGIVACDQGAVCTENVVMLEVTVDAAGDPVDGATVATTNRKLGTESESLTRSDGKAWISESFGAGTAHIVATLGTRTSTEVAVKWHCGECHCVPAQRTVELVLP